MAEDSNFSTPVHQRRAIQLHYFHKLVYQNHTTSYLSPDISASRDRNPDFNGILISIRALFQSLLCLKQQYSPHSYSQNQGIFTCIEYQCFNLLGFRLVRLAFDSAVPHQYRNFKSKLTPYISEQAATFLISRIMPRPRAWILPPLDTK